MSALHDALRLGRDLSAAVGGLALLHPGRADGWWWLDGRCAWHDGERLFVEVDDGIIALELPPPELVVAADGVVVVRAGDAQLRIGGVLDDAEVVSARRARLGAHTRVRRAPAGPWGCDVLQLPLGAARARDLEPFPVGVGVLWQADGYLYRLGPEAALDAVGRASPRLAGPHGAILVGSGDVWERGAAPGLPLVPLARPVAEPVRFARDGRRVAAVGPDGEGLLLDLVSGAILDERDAIPVGPGAWLHPDGTLRVVGDTEQVVQRGVREASWAIRGERLAGPGGRVWDLRTGAAVGEEAVRLGATVATDGGFASVHWETGAGVHLDPDGREVGRFQLPLDEDDVVVDGIAEGSAAVFGTAMGRGFRVLGDTVEEAEAPEVERPDPPEGWALPVEAEAVVAGRRWGWSTEGLLLVGPAGAP